MAFARRLALILSLSSLALACQPKQEVSAEPKKATKKEGAKTEKGHEARGTEKPPGEPSDPGKFIVPFAWEAAKDEPLALTRQFLADVLTDNQAYMEHGDKFFAAFADKQTHTSRPWRSTEERVGSEPSVALF